MKAGTLYLAVMVPLALWMAIHVSLDRWILGWNPSDHAAAFAPIVTAAWRRSLAALLLAIVVAAPGRTLLTLVAARFLRPVLRGRSLMAGAVPWVLVLGVSLPLVLLGVRQGSFAFYGTPAVCLLATWSYSVAEALIIAIAFRAQCAFNVERTSGIRGDIVLIAGLLLQVLQHFRLFCLLPAVVALVPLWAGWRRSARVAQPDVSAPIREP